MVHQVRKYTLSELLDKAATLKTVEEKVAFLTQHNSKQVRWYVDFMYNRDKTDLYIPVYTVNTKPAEICRTNIGLSIARIEQAIALLKAGNTKRYDDLMVLVLEELHYSEAKLIEDLFNGVKNPQVSKAVWKKVYPTFFRP